MRRSRAHVANRGLGERIVGANERGQMAVELAALIPVIVVVALIVYNLGCFLVVSASFDRVAKDAVIAHAVSPAGQASTVSAVDQVRSCVEEALGPRKNCEVEVSAERVGSSSQGSMLTISPFLTKFTCVLIYHPWPSSFSLAGVSMGAPLALRHERSLVVDCYRAGVVI
ncbi:MAG: hypothetical protein Q4B54_01160 [Coriobacteriales bacterium]|nr:hypothetical protein [Coriobacteriales bacterium]